MEPDFLNIIGKMSAGTLGLSVLGLGLLVQLGAALLVPKAQEWLEVIVGLLTLAVVGLWLFCNWTAVIAFWSPVAATPPLKTAPKPAGAPMSAGASSGQYASAWAALAGQHMGRAEAAGHCPGYRINGARKDEIKALYAGDRLSQALVSAATAARNAVPQPLGTDACAALLSLYGPRGLAIRNYVVATTGPDLSDQPGMDRGVIAPDIDPRGVAALHWLRLSGHATAIETICGSRYEMAPVVSAHHYLTGQSIGVENAVLMASAALATSADVYKLKQDRPGFCKRILADYGPASDTPVVHLKSAN